MDPSRLLAAARSALRDAVDRPRLESLAQSLRKAILFRQMPDGQLAEARQVLAALRRRLNDASDE